MAIFYNLKLFREKKFYWTRPRNWNDIIMTSETKIKPLSFVPHSKVQVADLLKVEFVISWFILARMKLPTCASIPRGRYQTCFLKWASLSPDGAH